MKTGSQLQRDVLAELEADPTVDHIRAGVPVKDGVVTSSGFVPKRKRKRRKRPTLEERTMRRNIWIGAVAGIGLTAAAVVRIRRTFRREVDEDCFELEAGSQIAQTAGGPVEYGRGGMGPVALSIHGAGGGWDQGLFVGRELLGCPFDIVAPSRFGYLRTPVLDAGDPAAQADAHAALLDKLEVRLAIVLGVSAGAPSAIEMALRHPDRVAALILVVPRAYCPEGEVAVEGSPQSQAVLRLVQSGADFAFWAASRLARASVLRFLGVPPAVGRAASPSERRRLTRIMRGILPLSKRVAGIRNDGFAKIGRWPLEEIRTPTMVISAADDLFGTLPGARYTAAHIPDAELMVVETGGHLLIGRVAEIRAAITEFLDRRLTPAARAAD